MIESKYWDKRTKEYIKQLRNVLLIEDSLFDFERARRQAYEIVPLYGVEDEASVGEPVPTINSLRTGFATESYDSIGDVRFGDNVEYFRRFYPGMRSALDQGTEALVNVEITDRGDFATIIGLPVRRSRNLLRNFLLRFFY